MKGNSTIISVLLLLVVTFAVYHIMTSTQEGMRGRRRYRRYGQRYYYPRRWWNSRWRDFYYGVPYYASYLPTWISYRCRQGCARLSDGTMGCVNPGYGPDSCLFASDCSGC